MLDCVAHPRVRVREEALDLLVERLRFRIPFHRVKERGLFDEPHEGGEAFALQTHHVLGQLVGG